MSTGGGGTQTTNANTNTNTASASLTINQSVGPDVTNALTALAGSQATVAGSEQAQAQLYSYALLQSEAMNAGALNAVAQSVSSLSQPMQITGIEWVIAIVSILGFLITAKIISLKQLGFK
jgi:hypothetical protein